ncbi:MAG: hypothetical protein AB1489_39925 [Acidobacteriota bacterium]
MLKVNSHSRQCWVAFEASVLTQQNFQSIAIPFAGSAKLDWYLKLWSKQIFDNDICQWAWWVARARVENNGEQLAEAELEVILKDAYVPNTELNNPDLRKWFSETDALWLDNVRVNIEGLTSDTHKALAIWAGILLGDYILSFDEQTRALRRPLSEVYIDLLTIVNRIIDNRQDNHSSNWEAVEFIVRTKADLLYLNLPLPGSLLAFLESPRCWREVWIRGEDNDLSAQLQPAIRGSFGGLVLSKERYRQILSELLERAKHMPIWAISFQESSFITLNEISEMIKKYRPLQAIYSKDMSDLVGGAKVYIVVASKEKASRR